MAVFDPVTSRGKSMCHLLLSAPRILVLRSSLQLSSLQCQLNLVFARNEVLDRVERKLAAVPAPEPAVSANGSVLSSSSPLPPSTPPNRRPALITPSGNAPGQDLSPMLLSPPPVVVAPIATTAPASASKQSKVAVILEVTLGVVVLLLVSLSAAAYLKPEWLPCCRGRRSRLTQYERHVQT